VRFAPLGLRMQVAATARNRSSRARGRTAAAEMTGNNAVNSGARNVPMAPVRGEIGTRTELTISGSAEARAYHAAVSGRKHETGYASNCRARRLQNLKSYPLEVEPCSERLVNDKGDHHSQISIPDSRVHLSDHSLDGGGLRVWAERARRRAGPSCQKYP